MYLKCVIFHLGNNPPLFQNKAWLFQNNPSLCLSKGWVLQRKVYLSADEKDDVLDVRGVGEHVDGLDGGNTVVGVEVV